MVHSATDKGKGSAPIKPIRKSWTMGSIPANDKDFLEWRQDQSLMSHGLGTRESMVVYLEQINFKSSERYERDMKEHKAQLPEHFPIPRTVSSPYPRTSSSDQSHFSTSNLVAINCPES
jgi:hypothetical protein